MAKQAFQLLDTESGNVYTLETEEDILLSNLKILLPSVDGKLALVKDVEDLNGKLSRGDITVGDANKLGGKSASEYADKNLSNVTLSSETLESLRGYTGSQGLNGNTGYTGSQGPIGIQGNTGYTGSRGEAGSGFNITTIANSLLELLSSTTTDDTFGLVAGTLDQTHVDYGKVYLYKDGIWTYITDMSVQGAAGIQGPKGDVGYTGSVGVGYTGSRGDTGAQGTQGNQGVIGYTGSKGDVGVLELSSNIGSSSTLDLNNANLFIKTLTANTTLSVLNAKPSPNTNSFLLEVNNGNFTITWWNNIKWASGTAPVPTTNGTDIYAFYSYDGGNIWRGSVYSKDNK